MNNKLNNYIISQRRYLHMHPEIGYNTHNTAKYIYSELLNMGYSPTYHLDNTCVIAKLNLNKDKTIAFRSDMDALDIKEINNLEYKSTNDYMHACGHDAHMAMLLGVAKLAMEVKDTINNNLVFIFQPAEEGPLPGGAIKIVEADILQDIDAFYAYHVTNKLYTKEVGIKVGPATSAPDLFDIKITGKGCHASTPMLGINPNIVASKIVIALDNLYKELIIDNPYLVITSTTISSNGAYNIIPNTALIKGTARSFTNEERNNLKDKMNDVINKIAKEENVQIEFNFHFAYDPVYNDEYLSNVYFNCANNNFENIIKPDKPEMIGEDFSYYRRIAPICLVWLGVRNKDVDFVDLHSPNFSLDENALLSGVNTFIQIAKKTDF